MTAIARLHAGPRMSQVVVHAGTAWLSGQLALDARGADVGTQTRAILARIDALLAEAGSNRGRILSATIWLTDMAGFDAMNAEWDAWLPAGCAPARATVGAALALPGFDVEIAVVAAVA
ncbi:MAG: RidA family protein [Sphingomonas sp.]